MTEPSQRMTARQIADMCGICVATVYRWADQPNPPAIVANKIQIEGTIRFLVPQSEIDRIKGVSTNVV